MRKRWSFRGGVKLEGRKSMSMQQDIVDAPLPKKLVIPVQQHIGEAAQPIVNVGDHVLKGQLIAQAEGAISATIHASSSGKVIDIDEHAIAHPSGLTTTCITVETDGKDEWTELAPHSEDFKRMPPEQLRQLIRDAGIVGLGGAGFPSDIKLNPGKNKNIDVLILNAAECEPYITCDAMLLQTRPRDVLDGLLIMRHALQAKRCMIGIEDNKQKAIQALQDAMTLQDKTIIDIVVVPTRYPAGGEKQLIYSLTGIEVPANARPASCGIVCHNVGTAAAVNDAVHHGKPLIERVVTLTGEAVTSPRNVNARIGTPMSDLLEFANVADEYQLIMGGPMMGFEVHDKHAPVIKTTNCLLAKPAEQTQAPMTLPCIRCGECARACPVNLLPQQMYWYARARDLDKIQDYKLFDCIECGCCSYVCPSHIPLVQYYRFAKTQIWNNEKDKDKSDHARDRHEFHQFRVERKKLEDEERKRKKREMLKRAQQDKSGSDNEQDAKQAAIQAALDRVNAKKKGKTDAPQNTDNLTAEQQQQIKEADERRARNQNEGKPS